MTAAPVDLAHLRAQYAAAGQSHVFHFWDTLTPEQQQTFALQLSKIDPARVNKIHATAMKAAGTKMDASALKVEPLPSSAYFSAAQASKDELAKHRAVGLDAVKRGEVAVLLLAGGQGTRLGSKDPKGCFDIKLPSAKSLFQLQAERLLRVEKLAGATPGKLPWYVMVSGPTRAATEHFFKQHSYFGVLPEQVVFFEQGTLPALTVDGKIYLESPSSVSEAPDGNGGVYSALAREGVLKDMKQRGIKYVHAYCVDNCLVKVADPEFLGFNISRGCDVAAKTVTKVDPQEPVGVVCVRGGKFGVVEYSEIPASLAAQTNDDGSLALNAANIANHFYTLAFLEKVHEIEDQLEFHVAHKKIAHVDVASGAVVTPTAPNGVKMELFIFDVFPHAHPTKFAVFDAPRATEFAPLKNKDGVDSPSTSRKAILDLHARYLRDAGCVVEDGAEVEIAPAVSFAGEGLEVFSGRVFKQGTTTHLSVVSN